MPDSILQWANLGLAAVIAVMLLNWKRADDRAYQKTLEELTCRFLAALEANTKAFQAILAVMDLKRVLEEHDAREAQR